jgi:hypothetical protein
MTIFFLLRYTSSLEARYYSNPIYMDQVEDLNLTLLYFLLYLYMLFHFFWFSKFEKLENRFLFLCLLLVIYFVHDVCRFSAELVCVALT